MGWHNLKKIADALVPRPLSGSMNLFASADGVVKARNDDDVVRPIVDQAASNLATSGSEVVAVDGGGSPSVGDVAIATAGSPTPAITWQSPTNLPFVDMVNTPVKTDADTGYTAAAGECIPVDLYDGGAGAADVVINLPSAQLSLNREIWVALVSDVGSYKVTINRAGSDTIDELTSWDLDSDWEVVKLRAIDLGSSNYIWKIM